MTGVLVNLRTALDRRAARPRRGRWICRAIPIAIAGVAVFFLLRAWDDYARTRPFVASFVSVQEQGKKPDVDRTYRFEEGQYKLHNPDRGLITHLERLLGVHPAELDALKPGDTMILWRDPAGRISPTRPTPYVITIGTSFLLMMLLLPLISCSRRENRRSKPLRILPDGHREEILEKKDGRRVYRLKHRRPWGMALLLIPFVILFFMLMVMLAGMFGLVLHSELAARAFLAMSSCCLIIIPVVALIALLLTSQKITCGRGAVSFNTVMTPFPLSAAREARVGLRGRSVRLELIFEGMADPVGVPQQYPLWAASVLEREGIPVAFKED